MGAWFPPAPVGLRTSRRAGGPASAAGSGSSGSALITWEARVTTSGSLSSWSSAQDWPRWSTSSAVGPGARRPRGGGRATVQLGAIGFLIVGVLQSWWATAAFVTVMLGVAGFTAGRRIVPRTLWYAWRRWLRGRCPSGWAWRPRADPLTQIAVVPILGILIGNAMTATTISGKRTLDALNDRRASSRQGCRSGCNARKRHCSWPGRTGAGAGARTDQTRTVGLVTLPGAFVGTLLGGATPLQAAAVQLVVLVGLLLSSRSHLADPAPDPWDRLR